MSMLRAQLRAELQATMRNSEQLLLTLGIPVMLLVFFSLVDILPTGTKDPIDFLAPGVLALAVMSAAMVSLGIGTGFERSYKVLKRLGTTPLGRGRLIVAKILSVVIVELVQFAVLIPIAYALGWRPASPQWLGALAGGVVGTMRLRASACASQVDFAARSTWRRRTASISCCCCSAEWSFRSRSSPARCHR
jgi:ABC-2 type transport system permease protein